MPELPEVETTCRGVLPYAIDQKFTSITIRQRQLRWPVPASLNKILTGQTIKDIGRRGKYMLFSCSLGTLIIHLGMSGKLSVVDKDAVVAKHDHLDFTLSNGLILRYTDPRRFGSIHWTT